MPFDSDIHHRRSIRLRHYDYATAGAYFVTICTFQSECLFGEVVEGKVKLNRFGDTVADYWRAIVTHFPTVKLDIFEIMPNHVHGIIVLNDSMPPVGARFLAPKRSDLGDDNQGAMNQGAMNRAPTVGEVVRAFKARCTHQINLLRDNPGMPLWQRNYYERVIRDDHELECAREYIVNNPLQWDDDENNLR